MKRRYELSAAVLQDGHVDRITGRPRCMVKMSEGPHCGLYLLAQSDAVLTGGTPVYYDEITRKARPVPDTAGISEQGGGE